jgi:hypothetical protein
MQSWHAIELGRGGYTVEKTRANVFINNDRATFSAAIIPAAEFACEKSGSKLDRCAVALHGLSPSYIFINLGVNDVGYIPPWSLPDEVVWKSNYLALVDACHAQWPAAQIYLSKPWKAQSGGNDISFDTLATWIDAIVAQRSSFVQVGDDERLWFKPKASGLSVDGIHPNKAGQLAAKNAKRALLRSHGAAPRNDDQNRTTLPNLKRVKKRRQPR